MFSCSTQKNAMPPVKTLKEKAVLVRSDDGKVLSLETSLADIQLFSLDASTSIDILSTGELAYSPTNEPLYLLAVAGKDSFILGERHINIEGANNIRDLGGHFTEDGYQVRWGKLYRSGKLSDVKKKEFSRLSPLGLNTIVDFRTGIEKDKHEDKWPNIADIEMVPLSIGDSSISRKEILKRIKSPTFDPDALMQEVNQELVAKYSYRYKSFFDYLKDDASYPLLYHCSAGKDRAGFATALILSVLGVDKETIMDEYLMSNYYLHENMEKRVRQAAIFYGIDRDNLRMLMNVDESYLEAAFSTIEKKYGSTEQFFRQALNVSDTDIEYLKEKLLYGYSPELD